MENEIIYNTIGKLIKKERKKKGITQEELALLTNYSLSFIANIESNTYQSFSIHTLYNIANALNKKFVKNIPVLSQKFEIETEMTLHALDKNYRIKEIPIVYRDRPNGSTSKLSTLGDGIKVVKTIVKMFKDYKPLQFFGIIAILLFLVGIIVGIPVITEFVRTNYITKVPSAILATGLVMISVIIGQCGIILHTIVKQHKENYELNLLRYKQIENLKNKLK